MKKSTSPCETGKTVPAEFIDISVPISDSSVVWPSAPKPEIVRRLSIDRGDPVNDSNLFMNVHTGTHIDAPLHHLAGANGADRVSPEITIGEAWVFDMSGMTEIDCEALGRNWPNARIERVLLKTVNSNLWRTGSKQFVENYCALKADTADWLLDRGVRLVGIDYLSVQKYKDPPALHRILLAAGVVLLEGLDLSNASQGRYELICLPLKLVDADGAPARAVLRRFP